jgi:hypothetical protein
VSQSLYFVLCRSGQEPSRVVEAFTDDSTVQGYGEARGFSAAIGPFQTRFAAELTADYGEGNPHMQTVEETEAIASRLLNAADQAIQDETDVAFDTASDNCQIFGNVKHMSWFREAVARAIFEEE